MPLLDGLIIALVASRRPSYNVLTDYMSDLAAYPGPGADMICAWWIAFPFLFAPFAAALYAGLRGNPHAWLVPTLLVVFGVCVGLCGIFRCDPGCQGHTWMARVHIGVSSCAGLAIAGCPFLLWLSIRRDDERWWGYRYFNLVWQVVGLAALVLLILALLGKIPLHGLFERLFYAVYYLWTLIIGFHLFDLGSPRRLAPELEGSPS